MFNKFSGSLVGAVLLALLFVSAVNAQPANEGGFLDPYTSGAVVVVDMDRDSLTTYTVRADYRVPSVAITFHLKDGTDVEGTTDQFRDCCLTGLTCGSQSEQQKRGDCSPLLLWLSHKAHCYLEPGYFFFHLLHL